MWIRSIVLAEGEELTPQADWPPQMWIADLRCTTRIPLLQQDDLSWRYSHIPCTPGNTRAVVRIVRGQDMATLLITDGSAVSSDIEELLRA